MSEKEIEAAARQWYADIAKIDIDAICDRYHEDGFYFDSFPTRFESGKQYEEYTRWAMEHMVSATAQLYQVKSQMFSKTEGIVTAHDSFTAVMDDGSKLRMMGRATFIFSKVGNDWKLLHLHASPQPSGAPPKS